MISPFKIDGPTAIAFSTGRTSAYLLKRALDENGHDIFRQYVKVCFENTGKELEESLDFGARVSDEFGIEIVCLEYRPGPSFEVVTFDTASRDGQPFEHVIAQRGGVLPNPRSRFCSSEMKTRTMHRYLRSLGWTEWDTLLGIRADEPKRVAKIRANPHPETKDETVRLPLVEEKVTSGIVGEYWKKSHFDLQLPNINGKTMHGNCDLCFLKPAAQVFSLVSEEPARAVWWAAQEEKAKQFATGDADRFRIDRPTYARMLTYSAEQVDMFDPNEEAISCLCGD